MARGIAGGVGQSFLIDSSGRSDVMANGQGRRREMSCDSEERLRSGPREYRRWVLAAR